MADPGLELQAAIYTAVSAAVSCDVFDHMPAGANYPFVVIGDDDMLDWSTKGSTGRSITHHVHAYAKGRGKASLKALRQQVVGALDRQTLSLASHGLVELVMDFSQVIDDPDPLVQHAVMRFRALVTTS